MYIIMHIIMHMVRYILLNYSTSFLTWESSTICTVYNEICFKEKLCSNGAP